MAILIYIFFDSLIGGMSELSYETIIDYESAHLQIVDKNYWEAKDELALDNLFTIDERVLEGVKNLTGILAGSRELNFSALLSNGIDNLPVMGKGIIPEEYLKVFALEKQFVEGDIFQPGDYKAVLGKRLAELLDLGVGDYITLLVKDNNNTFNTIDVEIAGLLHTSNPNVNQNIVYLPLDLAQQALSVGEQVSKILIRIENKDQASRLAEELGLNLIKANSNLAVYSWEELEAFSFLGAAVLEKQVILAIILVIAAIAIINTVILAALERLEEIGMMKAMGLQNREIVYTFVLESTGIGIIGGIIGIVLGIITIWFLSVYGMDFEALYGVDMASFGLPILGKIYAAWNPAAFIEVFVFGVLVSLLASILPAYWAADKDPVESIYHR
jgi:putative ABC transport system permease protein